MLSAPPFVCTADHFLVFSFSVGGALFLVCSTVQAPPLRLFLLYSKQIQNIQMHHFLYARGVFSPPEESQSRRCMLRTANEKLWWSYKVCIVMKMLHLGFIDWKWGLHFHLWSFLICITSKCTSPAEQISSSTCKTRATLPHVAIS